VIDVAEGEKSRARAVRRSLGSADHQQNDLAPLVGADLGVIERDAGRNAARGLFFSASETRAQPDAVIAWIERQVLFGIRPS